MSPEPERHEPVLHTAEYAEEHPEPDGDLRVVSWNIRYGEAVYAALGTLTAVEPLRRPDLLLLQEMDEEGVDTIARSLGHNYVYGAASIRMRTGKNFGNAILSPWPLINASRVALPRGSRFRGERRIVVRATVEMGATPVQAYCVHTETVTLPWKQRLQQFERLANAAAAWSGEHVVIGGDFNTATRRGVGALTDLMSAIGLDRVSAGAGPTFRRAGLDWPLDHIFTRGLPVTESGVVDHAEGSDHLPLWVRLRLAET